MTPLYLYDWDPDTRFTPQDGIAIPTARCVEECMVVKCVKSFPGHVKGNTYIFESLDKNTWRNVKTWRWIFQKELHKHFKFLRHCTAEDMDEHSIPYIDVPEGYEDEREETL